jgi:esterase/lipase superfamily enzyme
LRRPRAGLRRSMAAMAAASFLLAGCAERPVNVLVPMAVFAMPDRTVDMLVVTTRQKSATAGQIYSGERGTSLSAMNMVVAIPPDSRRKIGEIQWPRRLPANPETDFVTLKADPVDEAGAYAWYKRTGKHGRRVLVFVHGFNNTFEDAVYRFAQIVHDSGADAAPILFTWPSRASVLDYVYDKESATFSRDALETVLTRAAKDPNVAEVTVMAHSMGSWVLTEALRQMSIRHGHVLPKIRNVILASPDLDVDVFLAQSAQVRKPAPRLTLFISRDDRALAISRRIGGGVDRLGAIDPEAEPYRTKLATSNAVVIDLTKLKSEDELNHGKFAESPEIVRLIGRRLMAGQVVTEGDMTAGEQVTEIAGGAVRVLGSAAGAVVGVPAAIASPSR